ncbi:Hypothetical protein A7982_09277 [Minicystis rosea]|nr:Hypothetical protein A7982_09277 [Minicystis rosea]
MRLAKASRIRDHEHDDARRRVGKHVRAERHAMKRARVGTSTQSAMRAQSAMR